MTKRVLIAFLMYALLVSCEKFKDDKGQVLFYTNSTLINCPFKIEISLNGDKIGSIEASSVFSETNCSCEVETGIGLSVNLKEGTYNYSAIEVQCPAINRINNWTGTVIVNRNSCTAVFLNVFP